MTSADNVSQGGPRSLEFGFVRRKPTQSRVGLRHNTRQRLIDLVRNRG